MRASSQCQPGGSATVTPAALPARGGAADGHERDQPERSRYNFGHVRPASRRADPRAAAVRRAHRRRRVDRERHPRLPVADRHLGAVRPDGVRDDRRLPARSRRRSGTSTRSGSACSPRREPNAAHLALAELERRGLVEAVSRRTSTGSTRRPGSVNVIEVHGSIRTSSCLACGHREELRARASSCCPCRACERCGAVLKPDVVMFGELLPGGGDRAGVRARARRRPPARRRLVARGLPGRRAAGGGAGRGCGGSRSSTGARRPYDCRADLKIDALAPARPSPPLCGCSPDGPLVEHAAADAADPDSTSYGTPSRWRITSPELRSDADAARLITILDDNMSVKLVPVVVLLAAALAVVPATRPGARAGADLPCAACCTRSAPRRAAYAAVVKVEARSYRQARRRELRALPRS